MLEVQDTFKERIIKVTAIKFLILFSSLIPVSSAHNNSEFVQNSQKKKEG